MTNKDKESGFVSHLIELRQRLINSLICLAASGILLQSGSPTYAARFTT